MNGKSRFKINVHTDNIRKIRKETVKESVLFAAKQLRSVQSCKLSTGEKYVMCWGLNELETQQKSTVGLGTNKLL